MKELGGRIPLILDGGACPEGLESTIIRIIPTEKGKPIFRILRAGPITKDDLYDWDKVTSLLAAQAPFWEPGTAPGYHAMTQGFLVGEVVRRIAGEIGEVCVRGPLVMQGYWAQPEQTATALRGGWMHTGDGGRMDDDGFIYVVDRIKDMIVSGGKNIYSAEVENAITQLPQVSMAAVIGVPDDRWGEVPVLVLVRQTNAEGAQLQTDAVLLHLQQHIARFKLPRRVLFMSQLPKSALGKVQKPLLQQQLQTAIS